MKFGVIHHHIQIPAIVSNAGEHFLFKNSGYVSMYLIYSFSVILSKYFLAPEKIPDYKPAGYSI